MLIITIYYLFCEYSDFLNKKTRPGFFPGAAFQFVDI